MAPVPGLRLLRDVVDAARLLREVDRARWTEGPAPLVERMRARGREQAPRSRLHRRVLSRVVDRLDGLMGAEPNCYRRALVRLGLDSEWASEPVVLGLDLPGSGPTGHAWVERTEARREYDVEFRV
jgi:hypothetical protein